MTTRTTPRKKPRRSQKSPCQSTELPPKPDRRLWEADKPRAFEAGVRWFLAVSRAA